MTLKEKIEKIRSGELTDYTFTKDEFDQLIKALGNDSAIQKIAKQLGYDNIDQAKSELPEILAMAANGENYFSRLEKRIKRGELTQDLGAGLDAIVNLTKMGVASSQIAASNKALGRIIRPGLPSVPKEDESLSNAIYEAQRGTFDTARAVAPIKQGIEDTYQSDLQAARAASGGQSSTFGALAQGAALRKRRGYGEMAPIIDSIRAREQARLDSLLAQRQQQRQQDFQNRMSIFDRSADFYNQDIAAANELGLAGRENLFSSMGNLASNLSVIGSKYGVEGLPEVNFPKLFNRQLRNKTGNPDLDANEGVANDMITRWSRFNPTDALSRNMMGQAYSRFNQRTNPSFGLGSQVRSMPQGAVYDMVDPWEAYRRSDTRLRTRR